LVRFRRIGVAGTDDGNSRQLDLDQHDSLTRRNCLTIVRDDDAIPLWAPLISRFLDRHP
jgi:hypothetical protein